MDGIGRNYSEGKSRGSKEEPMGSRWYELPVPGNKKTCKGQDKKSRQHNDKLDKRMEWKGAAAVHGRIKVGIAWDTIRWTQCDNRNAGHKNADDDKQDKMFFSDSHIAKVERFRVQRSGLKNSQTDHVIPAQAGIQPIQWFFTSSSQLFRQGYKTA
jgi:hypothetical protein